MVIYALSRCVCDWCQLNGKPKQNLELKRQRKQNLFLMILSIKASRVFCTRRCGFSPLHKPDPKEEQSNCCTGPEQRFLSVLQLVSGSKPVRDASKEGIKQHDVSNTWRWQEESTHECRCCSRSWIRLRLRNQGARHYFPLIRSFSCYLTSTPSILAPVGEPAGGSTITCGSTGRSRGGVRAGCTPLMLKDSDRGGRLGSEILLATLWGMAGELWRLSRERSSTCGETGRVGECPIKSHFQPKTEACTDIHIGSSFLFRDIIYIVLSRNPSYPADCAINAF